MNITNMSTIDIITLGHFQAYFIDWKFHIAQCPETDVFCKLFFILMKTKLKLWQYIQRNNVGSKINYS